MRNLISTHFLIFIILGWNSIGFSQSLEILHQLSGWTVVNRSQSTEAQTGFRYLPTLSLRKTLPGNFNFDSEFSVNSFAVGRFHSSNKAEISRELKLYRLWARITTNQFEGRIGLQKINFGPATLLRPLMWFDRIDPRDPLQLTDGVYALLGRYYFLNNASIWLWGLYGNDEPKGWEIFAGEKKSVEYGGRFQYPLLTGEIAVSYHHRNFALNSGLFLPLPIIIQETVPEKRFALDGKWDAGIGIWFEGTIHHQATQIVPLNYQQLLTVGGDYTFGLGNGLHVLAEHLTVSLSDKALRIRNTTKISAFILDYPFSLIDRLMGICYWDWENHQLYRFINWTRTYDYWSFHFIGFWNPEQRLLLQTQSTNSSFTGRGFQIMVVLNR